MSVAGNIQTWYYKKRGKMEEIYPVKVEKFRVKGLNKAERKELEEEVEEGGEIDWEDLNIVFDSFDRGRTIIDDEEDREYFELMNESQAEGKVNYNDLDNFVQQPLTSIVMISRQSFVPVKREFDKTEEMGDGSGWPKLKYMFSLESYIDYMKEEWRVTRSMADNESEKWWQDRTIQAVMMALGFGIFFILASYGSGELYLKPFTEQLASFETALEQYMQQNGGVPNQ